MNLSSFIQVQVQKNHLLEFGKTIEFLEFKLKLAALNTPNPNSES